MYSRCVKIALCLSCLIGSNSFAAGAWVSGTVEKIQLHQYETNSGWDEYIWFSLSSTEVVGSCGVTEGRMPLVISKDSRPELFSTVLAARLSGKELSVYVTDEQKFSGSCVARVIAI